MARAWPTVAMLKKREPKVIAPMHNSETRKPLPPNRRYFINAMFSRMPGKIVTIDIPGFGRRRIATVVADYTGTLSQGGSVAPAVKQRLRKLARLVDLRVVTADTFGTAEKELRGIVTAHLLKPGRQDKEKRALLSQLDLRRVVALGNGNNDRLMLKAVRKGGGIAIAVDNGEGCAVDALRNADLLITGAANALDLLLDSRRLKATLRF